MTKTNDVVALGSALMDFLVEVNDQKLEEFGLNKGEMHLIEASQAQDILNKIKDNQINIEMVPGGSSANTLKGMALLGSKVIFCGKVGQDPKGVDYTQQLLNHGMLVRINTHDSITGHALTFITPDSERTFATHLGAAINLSPEDILEEDIKQSKVLHLNGYQLEGPVKKAALYALDLAKKHGTLVSIDLADPALIRRNLEDLKQIVNKYADILFLNEKEAKEFTGLEPEQAVSEVSKYAQLAIIKVGAEGSMISSDGVITYIPGYPAQAIDTTGAGDTFAAGFLHGFCSGWDLEKAGKLGSLMAARIVEKIGVKVKELDLDSLKKEIE